MVPSGFNQSNQVSSKRACAPSEYLQQLLQVRSAMDNACKTFPCTIIIGVVNDLNLSLALRYHEAHASYRHSPGVLQKLGGLGAHKIERGLCISSDSYGETSLLEG
jgi:hypothetical protein